jgi:hypothetical protein
MWDPALRSVPTKLHLFISIGRPPDPPYSTSFTLRKRQAALGQLSGGTKDRGLGGSRGGTAALPLGRRRTPRRRGALVREEGPNTLAQGEGRRGALPAHELLLREHPPTLAVLYVRGLASLQ